MTVEGEPCGPQDKPQRFTFDCVLRNRGRHVKLEPVTCAFLLIAGATNIPRDAQGSGGGRPQWDWDGNREAPTFSPSIDCSKACGWHGYIRAGRCVGTNGADEP